MTAPIPYHIYDIGDDDRLELDVIDPVAHPQWKANARLTKEQIDRVGAAWKEHEAVQEMLRTALKQEL